MTLDGALGSLRVALDGGHSLMDTSPFYGRGMSEAMHRRELTLLASHNALSADFSRIIALIESGRIDTAPWITHRAGFERMIAEFPGWLQPGAGVIKAIVSVP